MTATITIHPPNDVTRERIVAFGGQGAGKSYFWQRILLATPPTARFFVIDTDGAVEPMLDSPEFSNEHLDRITHFEPDNWPDYNNAIRTIYQQMNRERGDWFVLDMADDAWSSVQEFYEERKYKGATDSEQFLYDLVDGTVEEEDVDTQAKWGAINRAYRPMRRLMVKAPGHVFVAAGAKEMKRNKKGGGFFRERTEDIREFGSLGWRPGGQKSLGHDVRTTLYMAKTGVGRRRIQLMKDRLREDRWPDHGTIDYDDPVRDFMLDIARWEPKVEK